RRRPRPDRRAQPGASGRRGAALRPRVHARRDRRAPRPAARDRELPAAPRPRPPEGDRVKDVQQRTREVVRRAFEERPPPRRARREPAWPRWEGRRAATGSGYLTPQGRRGVAGDGSGDRVLGRYAGDVPPAWDPGRLHTVVYCSGGAIVLRDVDSGNVVWRAPIDVTPSALAWSGDGRYLAVTSSPKSLVLDAGGNVHRSISM